MLDVGEGVDIVEGEEGDERRNEDGYPKHFRMQHAVDEVVVRWQLSLDLGEALLTRS